MSVHCGRSRAGWGRAVLTVLVLAWPVAGRAGTTALADGTGGRWQIDVDAQVLRAGDGWGGALPHSEFDDGVTDKFQFGIALPLAAGDAGGGATRIGLGTIDLAVRWRLLQPDDHAGRAALGFAASPAAEAGLPAGGGHAQYLLPVWVSRDVDQWTPFGGGGFAVNPGAGQRNWWIGGAGTTCAVSRQWTLGVEAFYSTPTQSGQPDSTAFNLGAIYAISDIQHILLSAGRSIAHDEASRFSTFVGYLLTF
jgi:hypothetical protein